MNKKIMGAFIALVLTTCIFSSQVNADSLLSNPRRTYDNKLNETVTWDYVYFGQYPQAEVLPKGKKTIESRHADGGARQLSAEECGDSVVDAELYSKLSKSKKWSSNNTLVIDGVTYKRVSERPYYVSNEFLSTVEEAWTYRCPYIITRDKKGYIYFKCEPIKWRVLCVDNNEVLLLSDKVLDFKCFDESYSFWKDSTLRSWLNGYGPNENSGKIDYSKNNFIDTAFSVKEKSWLIDTSVEDNKKDKVNILSKADVCETDTSYKYGFANNPEIKDSTRQCKPTTFARAMGIKTFSGESSPWMIFTPNQAELSVGLILGGTIYEGAVYRYYGIRPTIRINISKLKKSGTTTNKTTFKVHTVPKYKSNNDATYFKNGTRTGVCKRCGVILGEGVDVRSKLKLQKPKFKMIRDGSKIKLSITKVKDAKKYSIKCSQGKRTVNKTIKKRIVTIKGFKKNKNIIVEVRAMTFSKKKVAYSKPAKKTLKGVRR